MEWPGWSWASGRSLGGPAPAPRVHLALPGLSAPVRPHEPYKSCPPQTRRGWFPSFRTEVAPAPHTPEHAGSRALGSAVPPLSHRSPSPWRTLRGGPRAAWLPAWAPGQDGRPRPEHQISATASHLRARLRGSRNQEAQLSEVKPACGRVARTVVRPGTLRTDGCPPPRPTTDDALQGKRGLLGLLLRREPASLAIPDLPILLWKLPIPKVSARHAFPPGTPSPQRLEIDLGFEPYYTPGGGPAPPRWREGRDGVMRLGRGDLASTRL